MLIAGDLLDGLTREGAEEAPEDMEGLEVSALGMYTLSITSVISCIRMTGPKNHSAWSRYRSHSRIASS